MEIWSAIIVGLFALCGGYLGAHWHWKVRHKEWLLRQRTEVFAQFVEILYSSLSQASKAFADKSLVERQRHLQVIFNPMLDAAKKVRLLLAKEWRQPFEDLAISISVVYIENTVDNGKDPIITKQRKGLEEIIERHIDDPETFAGSVCRPFFEKSLCLLGMASNKLRNTLTKGKTLK